MTNPLITLRYVGPGNGGKLKAPAAMMAYSGPPAHFTLTPYPADAASLYFEGDSATASGTISVEYTDPVEGILTANFDIQMVATHQGHDIPKQTQSFTIHGDSVVVFSVATAP